MDNELDDLFRQELDGHASPPGPDLWARLQARTAAEGAAPADADPVDARFRVGLAGHATPPRRELWERLEDEHLRPRQRRRPVVAWGRLAVAASLLLLLLAGGAGLWWNSRGPARGPIAATGRRASSPRATDASQAAALTGTAPTAVSQEGTTAPGTAVAAAPASEASTTSAAPNDVATTTATAQAVSRQHQRGDAPLLAAETVSGKKNRKIYSPQATGAGASPSSSPVASTAALRRPATAQRPVPGLPKTTPQPDAAAGTQLALGGRNTASRQPTTQSETSALAAASPPQIIEVEVRRGSRPVATAPVVAAQVTAEADPAEPRRRVRLGGLLRQAGHALRGEQVSLAEATGLPETVTVQARLGDRVLARTIRL